MEHLGCQLLTDYHDYYDENLCSSSYSRATQVFRYKKDEMSKKRQFQILTRAGLNTPKHGALWSVIEHVEKTRRHQNKEMDEKSSIEIATFNERDAPNYMTLDEAVQLKNKRQFAIAHPHVSTLEEQDTIQYISVGTLHCWLYKKSHHENTQYRFAEKRKNERLPAKAIAAINSPIFSIGFVRVDNEILAKSLCFSPTLKDLGFENLWSGEKVASAIFERLAPAISEG